jgi:hypothetical protein
MVMLLLSCAHSSQSRVSAVTDQAKNIISYKRVSDSEKIALTTEEKTMVSLSDDDV